MPWCPKCRNEYVEGISVCKDCGTILVDQLEEEQVAVTFGEQDIMLRLCDFLKYNKIPSATVRFSEEDNVYEVAVSIDDEKEAKKITRIFLTEEAKKNEKKDDLEVVEISMEESQEESVEEPEEVYQGAYVNNAERAEENKSSAYTLLGVGIIGFILDMLFLLDYIDLHLSFTTKYMVSGVMGAMFILFIIMGIISLRNFKLFSQKAVTETNLTNEITKWCKENLTKELVDEGLFYEEEKELTEEMKYFKRVEKIKLLITEKFMNLNMAFLDRFIDEYYQNVFQTSDIESKDEENE